jgi:hypothetical protein
VAQIASLIAGQVQGRGLAPKTANRYHRGIPRDFAKRALESAEAEGRLTVFSFGDAMTKIAREYRFAGDRTVIDQKASRLLELGGEIVSPERTVASAACAKRQAARGSQAPWLPHKPGPAGLVPGEAYPDQASVPRVGVAALRPSTVVCVPRPHHRGQLRASVTRLTSSPWRARSLRRRVRLTNARPPVSVRPGTGCQPTVRWISP